MHRFSSCTKRILAFVVALLICMPVAWATTSKTSHQASAKPGTYAAHGTHHSVTAPHTTAHRPTSKTKSTARSKKSRRLSAKGKSARSSKTKTARVRGQQGIDGDRAREIQEALIRAKYLDGEPSGVWDQRTKDALARFQSDNGWQSKVVPDSRALIKLGLGPNHDNVINPETSGIATKPVVSGSPAAQLQPGVWATTTP